MRRPGASEFLPLPYFGWLERPHNLPFDVDDCATAIFLKEGNVKKAADRLRVRPARLNQTIKNL